MGLFTSKKQANTKLEQDAADLALNEMAAERLGENPKFGLSDIKALILDELAEARMKKLTADAKAYDKLQREKEAREAQAIKDAELQEEQVRQLARDQAAFAHVALVAALEGKRKALTAANATRDELAKKMRTNVMAMSKLYADMAANADVRNGLRCEVVDLQKSLGVDEYVPDDVSGWDLHRSIAASFGEAQNTGVDMRNAVQWVGRLF